MIPDWVRDYVGLEFADRGRGPGFDCWGLVVAVYQDRLGVTLPSYTEAYTTSKDEEEIGALINRETQTDWRKVSLCCLKELDVMIFRVKGQPMHCGIVVAPGIFLHIMKDINSVIERWSAPTWAYRITSAWRHITQDGIDRDEQRLTSDRVSGTV